MGVNDVLADGGVAGQVAAQRSSENPAGKHTYGVDHASQSIPLFVTCYLKLIMLVQDIDLKRTELETSVLIEKQWRESLQRDLQIEQERSSQVLVICGLVLLLLFFLRKR